MQPLNFRQHCLAAQILSSSEGVTSEIGTFRTSIQRSSAEGLCGLEVEVSAGAYACGSGPRSLRQVELLDAWLILTSEVLLQMNETSLSQLRRSTVRSPNILHLPNAFRTSD
jgi:hypothetical protein